MFGKFEKPQAYFETGVKLSDLMGDFEKHIFLSNIPEITRKENKKSFIQFWLTIDKPYTSYQFKPTQKLIDAVNELMICVERDRIYFKVIVFDDCFHLYAQYNLIIGSRFLGKFDLSELPQI